MRYCLHPELGFSFFIFSSWVLFYGSLGFCGLGCSHIRLPVAKAVSSNVCSRTHGLATIQRYRQTTDGRTIVA